MAEPTTGGRKDIAAGLRELPDVWLLLVVFVVSLAVLAVGIPKPFFVGLDEPYYLQVSRGFLDGHFLEEGRPVNFPHPPLVKEMIAASIAVLGDNPWGWRAPSAVLGAVGVVAVAYLGRRLVGTQEAGAMAAFMLLLDPFFWLHSTMAMLDVPTVGFVLASLACAIARSKANRAAPYLLGAAIACKESAAFFVPVFFVIVWQRSAAATPVRRAWQAAVGSVLLPFAVYVASYAPFLVAWMASYGFFEGLWKFVESQFTLLQYHVVDYGYGGTYQHHPLSWFIVPEPIFYGQLRTWDPGGPPAGWVKAIIGVPSLPTWWAGLAGCVAVVVRCARNAWGKRSAFSDTAAWDRILRIRWDLGARWTEWAIAAFFLSSFLPYWMIPRLLFLFYMAGVAPFLSLGAAWGAHRLMTKYPQRAMAIAGGIVGLAVGLFFAFFPLVAGVAVPKEWLRTMTYLVPGWHPSEAL